jgi:hypothetical protein
MERPKGEGVGTSESNIHEKGRCSRLAKSLKTTIERQGSRPEDRRKAAPKGRDNRPSGERLPEGSPKGVAKRNQLGASESNDSRGAGRRLGKPSWRCFFKSLHKRVGTGLWKSHRSLASRAALLGSGAAEDRALVADR